MNNFRDETHPGITEPSYIRSVKCDGSCGKLFEETSEEFFSVYGNICRGLYGGIIGNNIGEDGKIAHVSIFCSDCFAKAVAKWL